MRQRVKLAQALVHDPELLILDEPLTGMDPIMRRKTIRFIKDWARAGKHIIVSSHILHEIESMTSNILLINNGRIVAEGNVHTIRELIDTHPHTVYVRGADPRALARRFLADDDVLSLRFEPGAVVVETAQARRLLRAAHRAGRERRGRHHRRSHLARRQPAGRLQLPGEAMTGRPMSFWSAARRVLDLSLGEMLWSRRTIFMALVVGGPVILAVIVRVLEMFGMPALRVNGQRVVGMRVFGVMIWMLFLRFIVPVLGVFYGTALMADEVEDKTITYLFTRPIPRGAVLRREVPGVPRLHVAGRAAVGDAGLLPADSASPRCRGPSGSCSPISGCCCLGLAVYGALFAFVGAFFKRPLVIGLVFAFGWEQVAMALPGYMKRFTIAYYLQALVPHAMPSEGVVSILQGLFRDTPSAAVSLAWLTVYVVIFLYLAARTVERKEYVLEQ